MEVFLVKLKEARILTRARCSYIQYIRQAAAAGHITGVE